jgi:hypothetical protein
LIDVTGNNDVVAGPVPGARVSCVTPGWTPDGSRLAGPRDKDLGAGGVVSRFLTMDVNGANTRRAFTLNGGFTGLGLCDFSWRSRIE